MTISLRQAFGTSGDDRPWGGLPSGVTLSSVGSDRMVMIDSGSTDFIRTPAQVDDNGNTSLGYRRLDDTASGGASEWLISWQTVATFSSVNATTLSQGQWNGCCIRNSKFYAGFYDEGNAFSHASGAGSYLLRADLVTGAIEAVFRLDESNVTVLSAANARNTMTPTGSKFWEVLTSGNIKFWYDSQVSVGSPTIPGIAFVEFGTDGSTVASQGLRASYEGDVNSYVMGNQELRPVYVAADESFVVMDNDSGSDYWIHAEGEGILQLPILSTSDSEVQRWIQSFLNAGDSAALLTFNAISDTFVSLRSAIQLNRVETQYALKYVSRTDLDRFFKETLENMTGVTI
jgi:hypothetical protein